MDINGPRLDPERWLMAVGILVTAEDSARRGAPWGWTTATILADTAIEILLGIISSLHDSGDSRYETFDRLLALARDAAAAHGAPMSPALVREAQAIHRIRNTAAHHASDATRHDARRATTCARQVATYVAKLRGVGDSGPDDLGIVTAVADLLEERLPGRYLRLAVGHVRDGDHLRAGDSAAAALESAIEIAPRDRSLGGPGFGMLMDMGEESQRRLRAVERAVTSLSVGLLPGELERLRSLVGVATSGGHPVRIRMVERSLDADEALRRDGAARAVEEVALVVFRLWQSGLLDDGAQLHPDVDAVRRDPDWAPPAGWRVSTLDSEDLGPA